MTPEKCPNCGTKLRRDMLSCPNCPMSFPEDDPASSVHPLKQSRYYQFLLPVLFFLGLGYIVWSLGMGLWHLGEANSDTDMSGLLHGAQPKYVPPKPQPEISTVEDSTAPVQEGGGIIVVKGAPSPRVAPPEPAPEPALAPEPAPVPRTAAKPAREWRLRGTVYDLVSLKPLTNCTVVFVDQQTNRRIETRTDSSGFYRTVVASLPDRGYTVQLKKDGYSPTYLDPGADGVRRMTVDKRRALARDLAATFTSEPAAISAPDAKPLVTDFFLAPRP